MIFFVNIGFLSHASISQDRINSSNDIFIAFEFEMRGAIAFRPIEGAMYGIETETTS